jgi:hypothetical protein
VNGSQQLVGGIGVGLVGLNFWTTQRHTFTAGALNGSSSGAQQAAARSGLIQIGAELLFVGIATLLAGNSQAAGPMVAVMLGLAILWAITHFGSSTTAPAAPGAHGGNVQKGPVG